MKIKTQLAKAGNNSLYIPISDSSGEKILAKFGKRILAKVNGNPIHCAILKSKARGFYIMVGKSTQAKIKANFGDQLLIEVAKDNSEYQMAVSEELEEVLLTDPEGTERFNALSDGKKRSLIHYVNKAKQIDTRINRGLKIVENLKMGKTELKELTK